MEGVGVVTCQYEAVVGMVMTIARRFLVVARWALWRVRKTEGLGRETLLMVRQQGKRAVTVTLIISINVADKTGGG